jgi:hypothetical protein
LRLGAGAGRGPGGDKREGEEGMLHGRSPGWCRITLMNAASPAFISLADVLS